MADRCGLHCSAGDNFRQFLSRKGFKLGTGFFIAERQVATNHHVIKDAGPIQIISLDGTDLGFIAIKAEDPKTDLAILTSVLSRPVLEFAGAATDGQPVIVIGNPVELEGTVSTGIVSAAERTPLEFQITAPVSPGSSGSPVLDDEGKVLGMIREIKTTGQNLNFAIRALFIQDLYSNPKIVQEKAAPAHSPVVTPTATPIPATQIISAADRQDLLAIVDGYMAATRSGEPVDLSRFVGQPVSEWYGQGPKTLKQIAKLIAKYHQIWPKQTTEYDLDEAVVSLDAHYEGDHTSFTVSLPFSWTASNGKKALRGHAVVTLTLHNWYSAGTIASSWKSGPLRIAAVFESPPRPTTGEQDAKPRNYFLLGRSMTPPHRSKQRHQAPPKNNKSVDVDKSSQSCLEHSSQHFALPNLFANDILCLLVCPQPEKHRLT